MPILKHTKCIMKPQVHAPKHLSVNLPLSSKKEYSNICWGLLYLHCQHSLSLLPFLLPTHASFYFFSSLPFFSKLKFINKTCKARSRTFRSSILYFAVKWMVESELLWASIVSCFCSSLSSPGRWKFTKYYWGEDIAFPCYIVAPFWLFRGERSQTIRLISLF